VVRFFLDTDIVPSLLGFEVEGTISSKGRVYACILSYREAFFLPPLYTTFGMASSGEPVSLTVGHLAVTCLTYVVSAACAKTPVGLQMGKNLGTIDASTHFIVSEYLATSR